MAKPRRLPLQMGGWAPPGSSPDGHCVFPITGDPLSTVTTTLALGTGICPMLFLLAAAFFFFMGLGFELRASHLQSRCSAA
jgi:hypothetical protein